MVCMARGGSCAVRTPDGIIMSYACVFSIQVADGHRARPCTSFVVVGCLFHHFHGFSAFLYDYHLAGLSLADALALKVEYLFLLVVVVYG